MFAMMKTSLDMLWLMSSVCPCPLSASLQLIITTDYLLQILSESVKYLRKHPTSQKPYLPSALIRGCSGDANVFNAGAEAASSWRNLEKRIDENLNQIDAETKHLSDINSYSKVNLERATKTLSIRHGPVQYPEEHVTFPIAMIPRNKNSNFYGRVEELKNIDGFLGHKAENLRTYTIYGRRGVGKTDIALEYAHTNPSGFEAIFWVNCETLVALRQSFTDIAASLNIPGADKNGQGKKEPRHRFIC
jgi:hypothetical protein